MEKIRIQTKYLSLGPLFYFTEGLHFPEIDSTGFVIEVFDSAFASEYCKGIWCYQHRKTYWSDTGYKLGPGESLCWTKLGPRCDLHIDTFTIRESSLLEFLVLTGKQLSLPDLESQILSASLKAASYSK